MEQPTKKTYQGLVGIEFCNLVMRTDFVNRYYKLCEQHPMLKEKLSPLSWKKNEVLRILSEIGRNAQWDARDKSYSFDSASDEWSFFCVFVLRQNTVDFAFSADRNQTRFGGSNYAGIARAVVELIDPAKIPDPPFPRPCCYSYDELPEVLRECFQLSDLLSSVLEKMPKALV